MFNSRYVLRTSQEMTIKGSDFGELAGRCARAAEAVRFGHGWRTAKLCVAEPWSIKKVIGSAPLDFLTLTLVLALLPLNPRVQHKVSAAVTWLAQTPVCGVCDFW